eukprot:TRINITY_DN124006_c0_g1_i1.p1 TRINITY_DN124006_c0_g1~~TRINITY_DN124006_c0_g1_i1.p1  ORF type:complete len:462 (+),score=38.74 TRINITY_DN124006_c0_g1_i1:61-1446(+)
MTSSFNEGYCPLLLCLLLLSFGDVDGLGRRNRDVRDFASGRVLSLKSRVNAPKGTGDDTVRLRLDNHLGVQYSGPVTMGGQTLQAVYDTGSFEILAMSTHCRACQSHLKLYNNETSESFRLASGGLKIHSYVGGSMMASKGFETVCIGGECAAYVAKNISFWQVVDTDMSVWTKKGQADFSVIVGMGHPDALSSGGGSLLERAGADTFSICLQRGAKKPGWLTIEPRLELGSSSAFRTLPVTGKHHWGVQLTSVELGKGMLNPCTGPCVAIVDSGTSMLAAPPAALGLMWNVISSIQHNCSNLESLPDLVFELAGQRFAMPPSAYVVQVGHDEVGRPSTCIPAFMDLNMTSSEGAAVWVLGMPFLRHFYVVFDRRGPELHIAEQGDDCLPEETKQAEGAFFANSSNFGGRNRVSLPGTALPAAELTVADVRFARGPLWAAEPDTTSRDIGTGQRVSLTSSK